MSTQKKRTYKSSVRKEQATQTKNRILSEAKKLFQLKGFEGVTIGELANSSSVSEPTIYSLFKSKRGVLLALMDQALPSLVFENLVKKVKQEKSAIERLKIAAKITRLMYDAEQEQLGFLRGGFLIAPEFQKIEKEQEERRYKRQKETFDITVKEGLISKELTASEARDILWAFTGRDMYRLFVVIRGWPSDKYEKWLAQTLIKLLIDPSKI